MVELMKYIPLLMQGTLVTLLAWILGSCISLFIGSILGILSCNHFGLRICSRFIRMYTIASKGIPAYVLILIFYFGLPSVTGINLSAFVASIIALGLSSGGYVTEIIRAGINSVPKGQWDACEVLGYPLSAKLRHIIMPQAMRIVLPALVGEFEQLLKSTSLLSTIGISDLIRSGMNIISRELNPLPIYVIIALIYLMFSIIVQGVMMYIERRMCNGNC
jgi:His/Glu/Gln/Arg/opine family amino acid ABC transporter permease subunit